MKIVLDTNVILLWLTGRLQESFSDSDICISVISEIELLSYPLLETSEEVGIRSFLDDVEIIQLTREIKDQAIHFRKNCGLKLPDAIIAATANVERATLYSTDADFSNVPGFQCVLPKV